MAYRKFKRKFKRRRTKRTYNRVRKFTKRFGKRLGYRKRNIIRNKTLVIAPTALLKFKFDTTLNFSADTANYTAFSESIYAGNDLSDPLQTGGTHRIPTGINQWAQFYTDYRVVGAKIRIEAYNQATDIAEMHVYASDSASNLLTVGTFYPIENPNIKSKWLNLKAAPGEHKVFTKYIKSSSVFGKAWKTDISTYGGNLNITGTLCSAPTNKWYFHFGRGWYTTPLGRARIDITYYTILSDRRLYLDSTNL